MVIVFCGSNGEKLRTENVRFHKLPSNKANERTSDQIKKNAEGEKQLSALLLYIAGRKKAAVALVLSDNAINFPTSCDWTNSVKICTGNAPTSDFE